MAKKKPVSSVDEKKRIMAAAGKAITPPACVKLDKRDMPFWDAAIEEFVKADLSDHQLQLIACLARAMSDLDKEHRALRREGTVATSQKGTPVINPRKTAIQMWASSILSMRRALGLDARAQGGNKDKREVRKAHGKSFEAKSIGIDDDDLIAKPLH